jgi:arylsulfatase A-like enzyme
MQRILLAALFTASGAAATIAAAESPRPNVVYFLVDDMGREDCGFMGGKEIRTPHVDKLAAAGATLDAFYAQPLCSPTRAALLTGRYPMRHGLQVGVVKPWATFGLPLDERTLADDLKAAGYATGIFGKWHLGHFQPEYLPMRRGFTRQYGHYNGALDYFTHIRDGGFDWHSDDKVCRDKGYSTTLVGQHAAQFVRDNAGQRPFFLYVPFNGVHSPHQPPQGGTAAYPQLHGKRQAYAAMLAAVDDAIGEIVGAVDQSGVRGDTLFIFSSDNGGPAPGRVTDNGNYRGAKGGLYEGGVRVAACAAWDGHIPAGSTVTEPLHVVDWRPTVLKLCGAKPTGDLPMDGLDVWSTLTAGAKSPHDVILLNTAPQGGAVRAGDWKLIVHRDGPRRGRAQAAVPQSPKRGNATVQLFDLKSDPFEKTNVAKAHPDKVKELRRALRRLADQAVPPKAQPQPKDFAAPAVWGEDRG